MKIKTIEDAFTSEGYVSIPFSLNGVGHPYFTVTMANNVQANFLLDTGAAVNLLDYDFASKLNINLSPTGEKGGGAGGLNYDIFSLENLSFEIGGREFRFDSFYAMDFSSIKEGLSSRGVTEEIQGILGFGFFKMTKCFIDYSADRIFILSV